MERETETLKVNDRRRFDEQGNPRSGEEPARTPGAEGPGEGEVAHPPEAAEAQGPSGESEEVAALRGDLEAARRRIDELARGVSALSTDREEYKQRLARERDRLIDVERGNVAQVLLEAVDDLDLALSASGQERTALYEGVRLIRDGILSKVQAVGIERVDLLGKIYDPNLAEAAAMELTADPAEDQRVVAELRAAYRLKDRVIRPGRVKVAKYVQPAQA